MRGDRGRDGFAADQAGADQLERVAAVGFGAGGADAGATVAAVLVDHPVRHGLGVGHLEQPAGVGLDGGELAGQPDRVGAAGGGEHVGQPRVVVGGGGPGERLLVCADRGPVHAQDSGGGWLGVRSRPRYQCGAGAGGGGERRDIHSRDS
jgi:hypothetical protein